MKATCPLASSSFSNSPRSFKGPRVAVVGPRVPPAAASRASTSGTSSSAPRDAPSPSPESTPSSSSSTLPGSRAAVATNTDAGSAPPPPPPPPPPPSTAAAKADAAESEGASVVPSFLQKESQANSAPTRRAKASNTPLSGASRATRKWTRVGPQSTATHAALGSDAGPAPPTGSAASMGVDAQKRTELAIIPRSRAELSSGTTAPSK